MKNIIILLAIFLFSATTFAQNSLKIKGSKIVTLERIDLPEFESIEVSDNLEVYLEKGEKPIVKIEADDNFQKAINASVSDKKLSLNTSGVKLTSYKKLVIRVFYTDDLKAVTTRNDAIINALEELRLDTISFNSFDESKLNLNVTSKVFSLKADDKTKSEINLKSENSNIQLSKNASLKALISSNNLKLDLYQKAEAKIEGSANNARIRLDNDSELTANNIVLQKAELIAENNATCSINADTNLSIEASNDVEILLYGNPKIDLKRFMDSAKLIKKPTK